MKKLFYLLTLLFTMSSFITSCRDDKKEVEVGELDEDVPNDNNSDNTYDTNVVPDDQP